MSSVSPAPCTLAADAAALWSPLAATFAARERVAVAFSGGVDSSLVAAAALRILGPWDEATGCGALAVLADSASLARHERDAAHATAAAIGIPLQEVRYDEFEDPDWVRNDAMRCYHCKKDLIVELRRLTDGLGFAPGDIAFGVTTDDLGDHRPGIAATEEAGAWRPLVEAGLSKDGVRSLARALDVPVWDKPATPCLASRVQYGESITPSTLSRVERAEAFVRSLGFTVFRVRHHGELARVEVPRDELDAALDQRDALVAGLKEAGYTYVTLDLAGFRSGAMNEALPRLKVVR